MTKSIHTADHPAIYKTFMEVYAKGAAIPVITLTTGERANKAGAGFKSWLSNAAQSESVGCAHVAFGALWGALADTVGKGALIAMEGRERNEVLLKHPTLGKYVKMAREVAQDQNKSKSWASVMLSNGFGVWLWMHGKRASDTVTARQAAKLAKDHKGKVTPSAGVSETGAAKSAANGAKASQGSTTDGVAPKAAEPNKVQITRAEHVKMDAMSEALAEINASLQNASLSPAQFKMAVVEIVGNFTSRHTLKNVTKENTDA
jgi:hypothetical protein